MTISTERPTAVHGTQSIDRALQLLSAFTAERPRLRIADLAVTTGLGQSTVSRMVAAMCAAGFVVQDETTGMYSLGSSVVDLASIALNDSPVHAAARQVAQNLAHRLDVGVNVAERVGDRLFYLCNFEGSSAARSSTLIGRGGPLHATGMGKALMIGWSREKIVDEIGEALDRYTSETITDLDVLIAEIERSEQRGYSVEREELALRRACVAAPIRNRSGDVVAAISISGSLSLLQLEDRERALAMMVIEHADQISTALGYTVRAAPAVV